MFSLLLSRFAKTFYRINSPLPRLTVYLGPLVGEWIDDKHERLDCFILCSVKLAISIAG